MLNDIGDITERVASSDKVSDLHSGDATSKFGRDIDPSDWSLS